MSDKEILRIKMTIHSLDIDINKLQEQLRDKQSKKKALNLDLKGMRLNKPIQKKKKSDSDEDDEDDVDILKQKTDKKKDKKDKA